MSQECSIWVKILRSIQFFSLAEEVLFVETKVAHFTRAMIFPRYHIKWYLSTTNFWLLSYASLWNLNTSLGNIFWPFLSIHLWTLCSRNVSLESALLWRRLLLVKEPKPSYQSESCPPFFSTTLFSLSMVVNRILEVWKISIAGKFWTCLPFGFRIWQVETNLEN